MVKRDFTRLTEDEKINGIKASKLPDHIRSKYHGEDVREAIAQSTEMAIQLGINMGLSPDDAVSWARKLQEAVPRSEFDSWVATLLDGGPSIFMNTLNELKTTYPNGAAGVALVRETDPAKIYVWNGTAWEDFGDYQGLEIKDKSITAPKLADLAVTNQKLDTDIKDTLNYYHFTVEEGKFTYTNGAIGSGETYGRTGLMYLPAGEIVEIKAGGSSSVSLISKYDSSGVFVSNLQTGENKLGTYTVKSTGDGMWIRVTNNKAMLPHEKVYVKSLDLVDDLSIDQTKLTTTLQKEIGYIPVDLMYGEFITSSVHAHGIGKVGIGPTYFRTKPIHLRVGESIEFYAISSAATLTLAIVDSNGVFEKAGIVGSDSSEPLKYFKATEDCYVVITNNTANVLEKDFYVKKKSADELSVTPQLLKKPIINFQFDDGNATDAEVKGIFDDYGLKCGFAVPTNVSSASNYYAWQREGFEVLSHSINGETMTNSMSSTEAERRMKLSKVTLKSLGFDITGWVTPSSSLGSNHLPAVGKYYEFAYTVSLGKFNNDGTQIPYDTLETDTHKLKRVSLESTTYENVIAAIDKTITDGGFLTFYAHDFSRGLTKEILNDVLTYVKAKMDNEECLVLKPTDAYKHFYSVRRSDIGIGENAVGTENIKDGSITADMLGFTAGDLFNDFLLEYDTKNNGTVDKMYQVVSSEEFNIYLRLNKNEFVKYTFKTNGQENYIRLFDIVISEAGRNKEYSTHTYENPTVEVLGTQTTNHYITEIGGKVYLNFYGTGVEFNYYSRSNGGVWRPKIDGRVYPDISTYNVNAIAKSTVIADDLPQTNHTLELEFIGADPNTVDAPRGWLIGGDTFVVTSESDGVTMTDKAELTVTGSNKDFAFHVKPLDIEGAEQFFPLHSGNNTTNAVERKLLIDGNVIDMTSITELTPFETGSFTEILESKMTYETGLRAKGKILWEFKEDRLSQELEYEFLKESMVLNGYVFMLPVQKQYFDYLKTDKREIVNQSDAVIGVSTHFTDLNVETIRAYFVEPYNMYNLEVAIEKGSHDYQRLWLQRRDESVSKLYPQPLFNIEFNIGDKLYFDGYFKVNNIF